MTPDPIAHQIVDGVKTVAYLLGGGFFGNLFATYRLQNKMVCKADCAVNQKKCSSSIGRSLDEIKATLKKMHDDIYIIRNGNGKE